MSELATKLPPVLSFAPRAAPAAAGPVVAGTPRPPPRPDGPSFARVLEAVGREAKRGESLLDRVTRLGAGSDLSAPELIALQAGVYRYVEVVDLASKLVDRATQAAKTVTQGSS